MASNGDFSRSFYGGVPVIIYDQSALSFGDMSRSYYGGIPPMMGPILGPPASGITGMIMVSGSWTDIASAKVMVSGSWIGVNAITVKRS